MTHPVRRAAPLAISAAAVLAFAPAAHAAPTASSNDAASFLAAQFAASGSQYSTTSSGTTYPDYGLSADGILALASAKSAGTETKKASDKFVASAADYYSYGDELYAGALAKSIITAKAVGVNPMSVGGKNLVSALKGLESTSGRFSDKSEYGDYSSWLTQSLALIAFKKANAPTDAKAVNSLLALQCSDGGFKFAWGEAGCDSDPDVTAFAVQALSAVGGQDAALRKAVTYLGTQQGADGGVRGGKGAPGANTNSTGLAAVAFALGGDSARAQKAQQYVAALQYGCDFPAGVRGAIAYNKAGYTAMKEQGAKAKLSGNEIRATAQAILAFTKQPYLTVSTAGSTAATPAIACSPAPTTSPTTATASPTSSSVTSAPSSTSSASTPPRTTSPSSSPSTTTPVPSSTATSAPSRSSSATTQAPSSTTSSTTKPVASASSTTGPRVDTDRVVTENTTSAIELAGLAGVVALGGAAVVVARRR